MGREDLVIRLPDKSRTMCGNYGEWPFGMDNRRIGWKISSFDR